MSASRTPAPAVVAVLLAAAVSSLGLRLFLPVSAPACRSACCCGADHPEAPAAPCGCSVSPAVPVPAAVLASVDTLGSPALAAEQTGSVVVEAGVATVARTPTPPRARSAPTQALLETFRN
ncbi:MAG: hypothetical protein U0529_18125 [Thermoanaerobaculia bacterium]